MTLRILINEMVAAHHWDDLAALSRQLPGEQSPDAQLLAVARDIDVAPFLAWLESEIAAPVESMPLASLAANPLPAWSPRHVIAVFDSRRLLERADVDALLSAVAARPPGTATVVLCGVESLGSVEEVEKVERNAWRLLVPGPKPEWAGQDLLEQGILLWAATPATGHLVGRIARDRAALLERIARSLPSSAAERLRERAEEWLAETVDQRLAHELATGATSGDRDAPQIRKVADDVAAARRQIESRWRMSEETLVRSAKASLQLLEAQADAGLRPLFSRAGLSAGTSGGGDDQLRGLLNDHLERTTAAWVEETRSSLIELERAARRDIHSCLNWVDWEAVNATAARTGRPERYPASLTESLDTSAPHQGKLAAPPAGVASYAAPLRMLSPVSPSTVSTGAAVGVGIGVVSSVFVGFNPVLSTIIGAVSGTAYTLNARERRTRRGLDEAVMYSRTAVTRTCQALDEWLRKAIRERSDEVERSLVERLKDLDRWLRTEADRAEALTRTTVTGAAAERLQLDEARARARSSQNS